MRRRGFTLVELLVVIGIITVLLAILMPALAAMRRHTNSVVCQSNLRQLGQAFLGYDTQNQCFPIGWITPGGYSGYSKGETWANLLVRNHFLTAPYAGNAGRSVFRCPEGIDMNADAIYDKAGSITAGGGWLDHRIANNFGWSNNVDASGKDIDVDGVSVRTWYAVNAGTWGWEILTLQGSAGDARRRTYKAIHKPSESVLICDGEWANITWDSAAFAGRHGTPFTTPAMTALTGTTALTEGFTNVLYVDGHVQQWPTDRFGYYYISAGTFRRDTVFYISDQ